MALVARDLGPVVEALRHALGPGVDDPFHDPGVREFGLENAVLAVGDTFVEVVSPVQPDTTAGRYLDRRGGDSGYMAIFQVPDVTEARRRINDVGVRVVWQADLPDIAGTHLHPQDAPGAIVSIDWANPADSWRWAGPAWTGKAPPHGPGGITSLTVEVDEPKKAASQWAELLGCTAATAGDDVVVALDGGRQQIFFVPCPAGRTGGITGVTVALAPPLSEPDRSVAIGGVQFVLTEVRA